MNNLIIISVEGIESNTEKNFFDGWAMHLSNINMKCFAIGKQSEGNAEARIIFSVTQILQKYEKNRNHTIVIFTGDGDVQKDIQSMNRAMQTAINVITRLEPKWEIIRELVMDDGLSLEDSLIRIEGAKFPSDHKRASNKAIFNYFAESVAWFRESQLDYDKIQSDLINIGSNYITMFNKIINK